MKWKRETKKIIKDKETKKGEIRKRNRGNEKERQRRLERETGKTRNGDKYNKYIIRKRDKESEKQGDIGEMKLRDMGKK